jgi:hypothetical protein
MRNHLDNRAMASAWTERPSDGETAHPRTAKLDVGFGLYKKLSCFV